jgi:ubiquinone/menaquinone biosynthesis C-methylase UbiE
MSRIRDPEWVREQYANEANLAARKSVYGNIEGPDTPELVLRAVAECSPRRVLEVGGGEGELAARIVRELGAELVGIDQSERMVEIQRAKGIDARLGDVERLPFGDGTFDTAVAAWMLYHATDVERAVSELARVLGPGGRLVAVTNAIDHLHELWELAGRETSARAFGFRSENGEEALRRHFSYVERRDVRGWVVMDDDAVRRYAESWDDLAPAVERLPLAQPLRARRSNTIFVAQKA